MAEKRSFFSSLLFLASTFLVMTSHFPTVASWQREPDRYHVEVRVYVDQSAFNYWKKLSGVSDLEKYKEEIESYFAEVQKMYDSLEDYNDVKITFEVESIHLLQTDPLADGRLLVDGQRRAAEEAFRNAIYYGWLKRNYDLALLITGYFLNSGRTEGFANINKVCDIDAVGIIKQQHANSMPLILGHEIGHILGANHNDGSCLKSGYIMNPHPLSNSPHRYSFSSCANSYFKDHLKYKTGGRKNCLNDGNKTVSEKRLGSLLTPDEVCARKSVFINRGREENVFADRKLYYDVYYHYSGICSSIECTDGRIATTLQGMACGKNKVCNRNVCEESYEGSPFVLDSCPLGDQPKLPPNFDKTCADIRPEECERYRGECCFTCDASNPVLNMTADDVCKEKAGKGFYMLRSRDAKGDKLCSLLECRASDDGFASPPKTNDFQAPDGMMCGMNKRCSKGECLGTNHGNPDVTDDCPFGDQDLVSLGFHANCTALVEEKGCSTLKDMCCQSCKGNNQ